MRCVSIQVHPPPGCRPICVNVGPKPAFGPATMTSHASAMLRPAPTAGPCTAATVGIARSRMGRNEAYTRMRWSRSSSTGRLRSPNRLVTLAPEQNARPAPVTRSARASASAATVATASRSSSSSGQSSALRRSGSFSVMVRSGPSDCSSTKDMAARYRPGAGTGVG